MPTLKPVNTEAIARLAMKTKKVVVIEEHNVMNGLYSILAEALVEQQVSPPVLKIGLEDVFAKGYGKLEDVRKANLLDSSSIVWKIRSWGEINEPECNAVQSIKNILSSGSFR